jgi:hypothetical protein
VVGFYCLANTENREVGAEGEKYHYQ